MLDNLGITVVDNRPPPPPTEFEIDLEKLKEDIRKSINTHSLERYIGAPDYVLAEFLTNSFKSLCILNAQVFEAQGK